MKNSKRLQEVLGTALAGLSDPDASEHAQARGVEISHNTINYMRKGRFGRERTVQDLARGIGDLLEQHYGNEIREAYGHDPTAVEAWLLDAALERAPQGNGGGEESDERLKRLVTEAYQEGARFVLDTLLSRGLVLASVPALPDPEEALLERDWQRWVDREFDRIAQEYGLPRHTLVVSEFTGGRIETEVEAREVVRIVEESARRQAARRRIEGR